MSEQELWNELGNLYFLTGSFDPAIHAYSRAIQLDEWFGRPYSNLALTYVQKGKYEDAIRLYQFSIDRLADSKEKAATLNKLGTVHRLLKDYKNALIAFQRADEIDPRISEDYKDSSANSDTPLNFSTSPFVLETAETYQESDGTADIAGWDDLDSAEDSLLTEFTSESILIPPAEDLRDMEHEQDYNLTALEQMLLDLDLEDEEPGLVAQEMYLKETAWKAEFPIIAPVQAESNEPMADFASDEVGSQNSDALDEIAAVLEIDSTIIPAVEPVLLLTATSVVAVVLVEPVADPELESNTAIDSPEADASETIAEVVATQTVDDSDFIIESFVVTEEDAQQIFAEQSYAVQASALSEAQTEIPFFEIETPREVQASEPTPVALSTEEVTDAGADSYPTNQVETEPAAPEPSVDEVTQFVDWTSGDAEELDFQINKFTKKIKSNPKNGFAWDILGNLQRLAGNYDEAEASYHQAISTQPKNAEFNYHLGLVYAAQQRHEEAINIFRETLELDSSYYHAHATLGGYYRKLGLEELARYHINKAIKLGFQNDSEYNRACLESICGRTEQALMLLETALQNRQSNIHWARHDPDLEFIRSDPRFQNLISAYAGQSMSV